MVLVSFPVAIIKYPERSNSRLKRLISTPSSRSQPLLTGGESNYDYCHHVAYFLSVP